jgi:hypothetical protein
MSHDNNMGITSTNPKDRVGLTKPPLDLIPPVALIHCARALGNGAVKYGPYNWRDEKVSARIYVAACMRHLGSWLDGEENASDSGVHHLGHALACLAILLDAQSLEQLSDDRPKPGKASQVLAEFTQTLPPGSDAAYEQLMGSFRERMSKLVSETCEARKQAEASKTNIPPSANVYPIDHFYKPSIFVESKEEDKLREDVPF